MTKEREKWDIHWKNLDREKRLFGRICSLHRRQFISRSVRKVLDRYFTKKGFYLDAGSGTSQTAVRLKTEGRKFIALDLSFATLRRAREVPQIHTFVQGDIRNLPFRDSSIDGIWNLGVMEHFEEDEIIKILSEFHRVLKNSTHLIMFWPPVYGSSQLLLRPVEKARNLFLKDNFEFFPDEPTRLKSKKHAKKIISKTPFEVVDLFMSHKDIFTYMVVVCKKG